MIMMRARAIRRTGYSLLVLLTLFGGLFSQERAALIQNDIAVFYPADFDSIRQLPSFALEYEPEEQGALPSSWSTRVQFEEAFGKSIAYVEIADGTDLYGTGEVTGELRRNGSSIELWNSDNYTYTRHFGRRLYQSHPWVLGVRKDGSAFGVLADNTWRQELSLTTDIMFISEGGPFRVFIIEGSSPQDVMKKLSGLIGTIPLPPLWSLGYHQCRYSYYPDTRVREIADTFREKRIPCDVIWMDIHYMDEYKVFTFSPERFPDPSSTNAYLHDKNFKSIWMIDPGVGVEPGYQVYDTGTEQDVWVKTAEGDNFVGQVWPGDCVFPDFTQTSTAEWWGDLYKDFMATGIDGVWNDMNEPAVFNGPGFTMPLDNVHRGSTILPEDVHLRYHNVYGLLMVKASRDGILKYEPKKRPFVLTRANFIGGQRYAATWTGDNLATWDHLKMSIPMSLNLGLSGQPFNGPDIGGFSRDATPDLFGHWISIGAFYPFSRAHTSSSTSDQEPWSFGPEIEGVARKALERRYRLLPYIYTLFYKSSQDGSPIMQPVFFADPADPELRKEDEAFLLGPDLLVIPKWAHRTKLPGGNWRSLTLEGDINGEDEYQADLKIRPGAIIPGGSLIQNTEEYSLDTLSLYISLDDKGLARGQLYHDAGDGYAYENGAYALMSFEAKKRGKQSIVLSHSTAGDLPLKPVLLNVTLVSDEGQQTVQTRMKRKAQKIKF